MKFSQHNLFAFVLAGFLSLNSTAKADPTSIDRQAQSYFHNNNRVGELDRFSNNVMGSAGPNAALGLGLWSYGYFSESDNSRYAGLAQLESIVATAAIVSLIKEMTNRQRPDRSDDLSFPSAHTAFAFSTATVLHRFYGKWVGIPAYALAGATAMTRMQDNKHWLTDTVAGAFIGTFIGVGFSKYNLKLLEEKKKEKEGFSTFRVDPMIGKDFKGLSFTYEF